MADNAPLIPSFRNFKPSSERSSPAILPTILDVSEILAQSEDGVSTRGWPMLRAMEFLQGVIPGIQVHSLGGMEPFQADGIWGPYEWYYRDRGGSDSLNLAPIGSFPHGASSLYSAEGSVDSKGWLRRFLNLWERLAPAPFLYEFKAKEVFVEMLGQDNSDFEITASGKTTTHYSWGNSPAEAWLNTERYIRALEVNLGWGREIQEERLRMMDCSREPLNTDNRVYPLKTPDFTVNWLALEVHEELIAMRTAPSTPGHSRLRPRP